LQHLNRLRSAVNALGLGAGRPQSRHGRCFKYGTFGGMASFFPG
jgi:hypothetical protein